MKIQMLTVLTFALSATASGQGIARSGKQPLRDAYTHVRVDVDGDLARTTVTQVFANDLDAPVEASYRFPLPGDAAVTGFTEWHDGKRADAIAADKDAAAKAYERAAGAGERAGLAESDGEGRFQMKLATIPARGTRRIELRYTQTLSALGGERSYVFPAARGDTSPPTVLDLEVRLAGTHRVLSASSLNHTDAQIVADRDARVVHLTRMHGGLERDLALRWQEETRPLDLAARAVRAKAGEPAYVEARLAFNADPTPLERAPLDVVLVADTSLSMAGEPLERARSLAAGIVAGLSPRDRVSLIAFSDAIESWDGKDKVAAAIRGMHAHGRSNLEAALDEAAGRLRGSANGLLVLMTDGQPTVGDPFEKPAAVRSDFARARVVIAHFNYPSRRRALESLLGAGARYVPDGPAGEAAVGELTRLAIAPHLDGVKLELHGAACIEGAAPARLAAGEAVRVMARADGDVTVHLSATLHGRPIELVERVVVPAAPDAAGDRGLPVEWARTRIRGLESRLDEHPEEADALRDQIRALGKQYALATRFTSFVVGDSLTPDRIKPGDPEIRVHAPRAALGVRAVLPWGETVECAWDDEAQVWLGRFLVPRGTRDGLYKVQVFVDGQTGTSLRTTLLFRVDSKPPRFTLAATVRDGRVHLEARAVADVFDAGRDAIVRDRIDLKRIVVQAGAQELALARSGDERWSADVELPSGTHALTLHATDFALNTAEASAQVVVP